MATVRHMQTGFIAGETSPLMNGRTETDHHAYGLETCENFVPFLEGPLVKRPGFAMICDADPTTTWLTGFRFNVTQEYVLEWAALKLRFYTNGGRIESPPGTPVETVTPYLAADAAAICQQQSFDRLYLTHVDYYPASLDRTGATTFVHANLALKNGPFADTNITATTVTVSATTGAGITVTASTAIFDAGHVGSLFRIDAKDFSTIKAWEPGMAGVVIGEVVRSEGKAYTAQTGGTSGTNIPIHDEGAEWDGQLKLDVNAKGPYGILWGFRHGLFGIVRITAIGGGGTTATADVVKTLPDSLLTVPSADWRHSAFSASRGYPGLVFKWIGRLGFIKDFDILASVAGSFTDHTTESSSGIIASDLAFRRTLDVDNRPLWVAADRKLLLGTATRELAVGPVNATAAVSGENISSDAQSHYGSEPIAPLQAGTQTVFVERGGRRIRSSDYDYSRDRYDAPDLTSAARHITAGGVIQLAYHRTPQAMVHAVRGDGQVIVHPLTRGELKGFGRIVLGGTARALSAVSIVGEDGKTDELWLLIERTRWDGVKREIWKQEPWRELGTTRGESFYVDGGVRIAAAGGQTVFNGLLHLKSQAVAVLADGGVVPSLTVSAAGVLTLPAEAVPATPYIVIVGLGFTATAKTRTPAVNLGKGPIQGVKLRVVKVILRLLETFGLRARAGEGGPLDELIDRSAADLMDNPVPYFSGDTSGAIDASFSRDGSATFVSSDPLPAIITAAMLKLNIDDSDA